MAAQYYTVRSLEKSDFQDRNGNYWCTAVFEGVGEPIAWVMKAETVQKIENGKSYYGEIRDYTSSKGKIMPRFYKEKEPETETIKLTKDGVLGAPPMKKEWQPRDDEAIKAQWAIGQAIQLYSHWNKERPEYTDIEETAETLMAIVSRLKVGRPKLVDGMTADQIAAQFGSKDEVHEVADEPINLGDIPF